MKILFILESFPPNIGGVETLFKNLTRELEFKGHYISVLTNQVTPKLPYKQRNGNLTVYRMPFLNRYLFTVLALFPAFYLATKHDLIHTTSYNAGFPAFFAGMFARRKVVITFHEFWGSLWFQLPFMPKWKLRLHYLYEQILIKLPFHHYIAVSDYTASSLQKGGISKSKIARIYNGIDYERLKPYRTVERKTTGEEFKFLFYGRLGISKGLDILLEAISQFKSQSLSFRVDIVIPTKPASFFKKIRSLIKKLNIDDRISLFHDLEEAALFHKVAEANCIIIPSASEGFGFTAAESSALNKPVISSHRGSLPEVLGGRIIAMKEYSADALEACMKMAIDGIWEETPIRRFDLKDSIAAYQKMYNRIM